MSQTPARGPLELGFLFGNVDDRGHFENDYEDQSAGQCIKNLGSTRLGANREFRSIFQAQAEEAEKKGPVLADSCGSEQYDGSLDEYGSSSSLDEPDNNSASDTLLSEEAQIALKEQRRLFKKARRTRNENFQLEVSMTTEDAQDAQLPPYKIFPVKQTRLIYVPHRRQFGLLSSDVFPSVQLEQLSENEENGDELFNIYAEDISRAVALDEDNVAIRQGDLSKRVERTTPTQSIVISDEELEENDLPAAPLSKILEEVEGNGEDNEHFQLIEEGEMVELLPWELDICWGDSGDGEGNDSPWEVTEDDEITKEKKAPVNSSHDSSSTDEDDWEDGFSKNRIVDPAMPTSQESGLNKFNNKDRELTVKTIPNSPLQALNPLLQLPEMHISSNENLEDGTWLEHIMWDSWSEYRKKHFISSVAGRVSLQNGIACKTALAVPEIPLRQNHGKDLFNISNDEAYPTPKPKFIKNCRTSVLHRLRDSHAAVMCLTTKSVLSRKELSSFRRPLLNTDGQMQNVELQIICQKLPKDGNQNVPLRVPNNVEDLLCSTKDFYNISLFEYSLERQPCILPIPGMASRIVRYQRKSSLSETIQKTDPNIVLLSPLEPPPLHTGELKVDEAPLSVVESKVYSAPCVESAAPATDFLIIRRDKKAYLREISSVISVGVTEPKLEVMYPGSDRFKKYSRERAFLMILRDVSEHLKKVKSMKKSRKKGETENSPETLCIRRKHILAVVRKKTSTIENSLLEMLKDVFDYKAGKFFLRKGPSINIRSRKAEILRTVVTPEETAACEAMEAGIKYLEDRGIEFFTNPVTQGYSISSAAEKLGVEEDSGVAYSNVADYIKSLLLWSPWFRSRNFIQSYKQQSNDIEFASRLNDTITDIKKGGSTMKAKVLSLGPDELKNLLFKELGFKRSRIPVGAAERRDLLCEIVLGEEVSFSSENVDRGKVIQNIIENCRADGIERSAAFETSNASTTEGLFVSKSLKEQRKALREDLVIDPRTVAASTRRLHSQTSFDVADRYSGTRDTPRDDIRSEAAVDSIGRESRVEKASRKCPHSHVTADGVDQDREAGGVSRKLPHSQITAGGVDQDCEAGGVSRKRPHSQVIAGGVDQDRGAEDRSKKRRRSQAAVNGVDQDPRAEGESRKRRRSQIASENIEGDRKSKRPKSSPSKKKKRITKIKVKRKVKDKDGNIQVIIEEISDPEKIEAYREKAKRKK